MSRNRPIVTLTVRDGDAGDERVELGDRLLAFQYHDADDKADKMTLRLDNFDLELLQDARLRRGQKLEVSWGYPERMALPREVIIKKVKGFERLTIEGLSTVVLMNRIQKARSFHSMRRSEVVEQLASENGFTAVTTSVEQTEEVFETINQAGETDAHFMQRMAQREGFVFYVDHTGLHWHEARYTDSPARVLHYYTDPNQGDIIKVTLESDLMDQPGRVAVKGSSPDTKTASTGTGSDAETEHTTLGTFVEVVDPESGTITTVLQRNATEAQRNTSAPTEQSRKREADVRYKHAARRRLKLSLDIVGDPLVPTKTVVATRGLGDYLNGNYYVKEATHVISGSGYACKLQLRSDAPKRGTGQTTAAKQNRNKAPESSAGGTAPGTETELSEVVNEQTGESQFVRQ